MVDVARARRMAVRIREVAAATLDHQVKDPRLGLVTLTDATVTPDLREATLFWTAYGDDQERAGSAAALESATGVVRAAVGRALGVRYTPSIAFVADAVPETAAHLEEVLELARLRDAELAAVREGASPAGDPDPYRKPRQVVDGGEAADADAEAADADAVAVADADADAVWHLGSAARD